MRHWYISYQSLEKNGEWTLGDWFCSGATRIEAITLFKNTYRERIIMCVEEINPGSWLETYFE